MTTTHEQRGDDVPDQRISSDDMMAAANEYASKGWVPVAINVVGPDMKTCSCVKGGNCGKSAGKHPISAKWQSIADAGEGIAELEKLQRKSRRFNLGLLTGTPSGFFVLDIDVDKGGGESMVKLVKEHGRMPPTRIIKTGTGGFHYYFQMPADFDVTNRDALGKAGFPAVDIRGTGGQVVAPPSVSWAGGYEVKTDNDIAPAPEWLLHILRAAIKPAANAEVVEEAREIVATEPTPQRPARPAHERLAASGADGVEVDPAFVQTPQQIAYENAIVKGELARVQELPTKGWTVGWDTTTFEAACQLIELANADWSSLAIDEAEMLFLDGCPPEEPGYDPAAKWASAIAKVGDKARPAPKPRADVLYGDDSPVQKAATVDPSLPVDASRKGTSTGGSPAFGLSDLGNADRLVHWKGDQVRYAADAQTWLTYNGGVWRDEIAEVEVERLSKQALALATDQEAGSHSDVPDEFTKAGDPKPTEREQFYGWMGKSQMYAKIVAMRSMARSDDRVSVAMGEFDVNPSIFNAANCAIDLVKGETVPHAPELMFRHQSTIDFDREATCPLWEKFLLRVQPDPAMRDYLQKVLGYSLTGRMDEQSIFIHVGPGATGKTTFLEVVGAVLGNYSQKLERDTLMSKIGSTSGATPDVARMAGARFLAASETAAGRKLDDERIKELVGGDTQTARHLYGKPFDFVPTGKIHMATNHLPSFESGGDGMGRRLKLVPWEQQIPEGERDKTLKERIVATEAAGVLAWLVRGAVAWHAEGLATPEIVVERSKEHTTDADPVWPFINERLEQGEDYATEFEQVYHAYEMWCQANGNKPMAGRSLSMALRERLGADAKYLHHTTRRSMFRVKVALQQVPAHHQEHFKGIM